MRAVRRVKISVSLAADLLQAVDRLAAREGASRSAVMERWLRDASTRARMARLEEETAAYYDSLTAAEREDDAAWAASSSRAARQLRIDDVLPQPPASRRPSRRRAS